MLKNTGSKTHTIHKLNTTPKKQTTQNTAKQNYTGMLTIPAFYKIQSGNEVALFYNAAKPTWGKEYVDSILTKD